MVAHQFSPTFSNLTTRIQVTGRLSSEKIALSALKEQLIPSAISLKPIKLSTLMKALETTNCLTRSLLRTNGELENSQDPTLKLMLLKHPIKSTRSQSMTPVWSDFLGTTPHNLEAQLLTNMKFKSRTLPENGSLLLIHARTQRQTQTETRLKVTSRLQTMLMISQSTSAESRCSQCKTSLDFNTMTQLLPVYVLSMLLASKENGENPMTQQRLRLHLKR